MAELYNQRIASSIRRRDFEAYGRVLLDIVRCTPQLKKVPDDGERDRVEAEFLKRAIQYWHEGRLEANNNPSAYLQIMMRHRVAKRLIAIAKRQKLQEENFLKLDWIPEDDSEHAEYSQNEE